VVKAISANAMLQVINETKDLVDDINAILAWDPAAKPGVSAVLDCLSGTNTEMLLETQSGTIISGSASISLNESGHVTADVSAGIPYVASVGVGVTVKENCTITMAESYSMSSGWMVNPSATHVQGTISASGFGTATVAGYTGQINLNVPSVTFVGTGTGQVTISPHVAVSVTYLVNGHGVSKGGTLYQSSSLSIPSWTFDVDRLTM
jgi:hypothetical protein